MRSASSVPSRSPKPRAAGWQPVIAHACVLGMTQVLWLTYAPITGDAATSYGVSEGAVVWLANVYPLLYFLLALPVGAALDRRPLPVLAAGALLTAAAGLTRAVSESYEAALAGQLLGAFAQPVLYNGIVVVARASLPEEQRATGIAVGTVGSFVGLILGLVLPPLLADGTDLSTLLWVEGGAALLFGLVQLATLRMPLHAHMADELEPRALRKLLADPAVRALALVSFGGFGIFATLLTALEPLLGHRGIETGTTDLITVAMTLVGILASLVVPPLVARRRTERRLLTVALLGASLAVALMALDLPVALLAALALVIGGLLLPALPVLLELGERRHPILGGTVSAIIFLTGNLGVAILTAAAIGLKGWAAPPFLLLSAVALLALGGARRGLRELS
ncbi:MAG: MFS transporter [Baekduia sp.]